MPANMTFVDGVTVIPADWLNNVNAFVNAGGGGGSGLVLPLSVAQGGTGQTASSGTGPVLLQNSPTLNTPTVNSPTVGSPVIIAGSVDGHGIGYREVPQNIKGAAYTTVLGDSGGHIFHPVGDVTARVWTIADNATVAYPIGTELTFVCENGAGSITIAIAGSDTMRLSGSGALGSRILAANGMASALKVTATSWIINGVNLT